MIDTLNSQRCWWRIICVGSCISLYHGRSQIISVRFGVARLANTWCDSVDIGQECYIQSYEWEDNGRFDV